MIGSGPAKSPPSSPFGTQHAEKTVHKGKNRTRPGVNADPRRDEEGSALIEFVGVALLLLLPLLYLLLSVFSVQRAAFAVTQAAREAGRAYATAPSTSVARERAGYAAQLALTSQGVRAAVAVHYAPAGSGCSSGGNDEGAASLVPGARFVVCVRTEAELPLGGVITVNGQYGVSVDTFRTERG